MRIAELNMCVNGSTGKIMLQIADKARAYGHEVRTYSTHQYHKKYKKLPIPPQGHKYYGTYVENGIHFVLARQTGRNGCFGRFMTWRLIRELKEYKPDILHLHNLHGFCINLPLLFKYIRQENIRVIWTLHDCWSFTGHCPHFESIGCDKWKTGCYECSKYREYPKSIVDNSSKMYRLKKRWFTGLNNMTLVTPSKWLKNLVKESFMKEYPVKVIPNGIDLSVFQPANGEEKRDYLCEGKYMLLGVASSWGEAKGLDVFIELSKRLSNEYQIVLVGTNDEIESVLPETIVSIQRTESQKELARLYSAADVFIDPTREDNYPTVNMEALACGTPVITFDTGGSPEIIDETCGVVVPKNDVDKLIEEIERVICKKVFSTEQCLKKAKAFDMNQTLKLYMELYQ